MPGNDDKKVKQYRTPAEDPDIDSKAGEPRAGFRVNSKGVYVEGNPDAQILAKAYEEYAKDGLTSAERAKIEKMDEILKDAAIVITPTGDKATVVQGDGKTFTLNGKPSGRSR